MGKGKGKAKGKNKAVKKVAVEEKSSDEESEKELRRSPRKKLSTALPPLSDSESSPAPPTPPKDSGAKKKPKGTTPKQADRQEPSATQASQESTGAKVASYKVHDQKMEEEMATFLEGYPLVWQVDHDDHKDRFKIQQVWEAMAKKFGFQREYFCF